VPYVSFLLIITFFFYLFFLDGSRTKNNGQKWSLDSVTNAVEVVVSGCMGYLKATKQFGSLKNTGATCKG